ncbi:MAG TPA: hypothetical protein VMF66_05190 [Candidatus Acidoferrum sp.]|nr:hypothetical protein [Candidatus Acidoferrum sp.]
MRALATWMFVLGLAATPIAAARTGDNGSPAAKASADKDTGAKNGSSDAPANAAKAEPAKASPAKATAPAKAEPSPMEVELQQLRDLLESQAKQLQEQNEQLKQQQEKMETLEKQLNGPGSKTAAPAATASSAPSGLSATAGTPASASATPSESSSVATAESAPNATAAVTNVASNAATADGGQGPDADQPLSWRFKGVTFTPGGFFAAETAWRQRGLSADVNTPFNSLPMPGSSAYNISEFNASGRQSRIAMLVQGKLHDVTLGGYYEADFLSAGTTSNDNQSNSYTLRQRQFWAQAAFSNGWTITGGQMWSLVTQTAKGLDNRTEVLPETIDAQYSVGFSWARQYGMRLVKDFNNKVWLGLSVEAPQITFKGSGTTTPFLFGEAGVGGGLYNSTANYSFNLTPDFVVKAAFEPGFGHYEVFGLVSTFRDRVFPTGVAPYNDKTAGGGGGANAWFPFDNGHVNIGLHALVGSGVGRYGSAQSAPDVTVRPDGTFATVRSYQGLGTLAFHYPKWDVYFHVGDEYGARTQYISGTGTIPNEGFGAIGFNNAGCWAEVAPGSGGYAIGSLANCTNNIKDIIEGTAGLWYSFYSGPKGTFKFGLQFSHEAYNTWEGVGSTGVCTSTANPSCAPSSNENMVFTSVRYYIP